MEIIVLGTGCANCKTTYNRVAKVIADTNSTASLKKEEDILEIVKYSIMSLPAIVVDGEVKLKGYVPSEDEIKKLNDELDKGKVVIDEIEIDGNKVNVYVIEGSFVDRLLTAVNVNDADSLRYFHKVLKNKGILDELREMGIEDGDFVRLNDFEFEYLM